MVNHWCWWESPGGGQPGLKSLLTIKKDHPEATADAVATIQRYANGNQLRRGAIEHLRDQIFEVRAKDGSIWLRIYFFKEPGHLIGTAALKKKDNRADNDAIETTRSRKTAWKSISCSGEFNFDTW